MDFVNSVLWQISTTFTLPALKSILNDDSSSSVENSVRLILFLILTPLTILAQLAVMAVVKLLMITLELWASLKENSMADNLTMMINTILFVPGKMLFNEDNNKEPGKAIYEDIYKEIYEVSHDSGIDSSEFSDSPSEPFDGGREKTNQQQPTRHSVEKGKVIMCQQQLEEDEEREEFVEPHDAWVLETGKGAFKLDFKEEGETFYLVFWYWICNNMLS